MPTLTWWELGSRWGAFDECQDPCCWSATACWGADNIDTAAPRSADDCLVGAAQLPSNQRTIEQGCPACAIPVGRTSHSSLSMHRWRGGIPGAHGGADHRIFPNLSHSDTREMRHSKPCSALCPLQRWRSRSQHIKIHLHSTQTPVLTPCSFAQVGEPYWTLVAGPMTESLWKPQPLYLRETTVLDSSALPCLTQVEEPYRASIFILVLSPVFKPYVSHRWRTRTGRS